MLSGSGNNTGNTRNNPRQNARESAFIKTLIERCKEVPNTCCSSKEEIPKTGDAIGVKQLCDCLRNSPKNLSENIENRENAFKCTSHFISRFFTQDKLFGEVSKSIGYFLHTGCVNCIEHLRKCFCNRLYNGQKTFKDIDQSFADRFSKNIDIGEYIFENIF